MATIIKRDQPHMPQVGTAVSGVVMDLHAFETQGEAYLQQVRAAAAKIVQEAQTEAAAVRTRAEKAGRDAAEQAIERLLDQKVASQMKTLKPALAKVADELVAARGEWLDHWHAAAVRMARLMAERIIRRELARDPAITTGWIREALELATGAEDISVRLAPQDFGNLKSSVEQISSTLTGLGKVRVVADGTVAPGGCLVTTRFGVIDHQINSQLARLEQELTA